MPSEIRCACGWVANHANGSPSACPQCGQPLSTTSNGARQAKSSIETVRLAPFYPPDIPQPPSQTWAYEAVEVAPRPGEPTGQDPPEENDFYRLLETSVNRVRRQSDDEEQRLRRAYKRARWELRRYGKRRDGPWPLEESIAGCLLFPLRVWWGILALAVAWTLWTPLLVLALPTPDNNGLGVWLARLPFAILPLALLGSICGFLRVVLRSGWPGHPQANIYSLFDVRAILAGGLAAIVTFLAGPILLVAAAVWFWVDAGTLRTIDQLVLFQLAYCSGAAWIYLLLAVEARGRLRDANAMAVGRLVRQHGWPAWVFPLLSAAILTGLVFMLMESWTLALEEPFAARLSELFLWITALYFWSALTRWYGMMLSRQ